MKCVSHLSFDTKTFTRHSCFHTCSSEKCPFFCSLFMRMQQIQKTQERGKPRQQKTATKTQSICKPWDSAMNDTITRALRTHLTGISWTSLFHKATLFMPPAGQTPLHFEKPPPSAEYLFYTILFGYKPKLRAGLKRQPFLRH